MMNTQHPPGSPLPRYLLSFLDGCFHRLDHFVPRRYGKLRELRRPDLHLFPDGDHGLLPLLVAEHVVALRPELGVGIWRSVLRFGKLVEAGLPFFFLVAVLDREVGVDDDLVLGDEALDDLVQTMLQELLDENLEMLMRYHQHKKAQHLHRTDLVHL